jgi:hypothetical protein
LPKICPNQRFIDILTFIVINNARIDFQDNASDHIQHPNHSSAFAHPEIITTSIQNELQKEHIKQISSLPQDLFHSPIGLISKHTNGVQSGWRVIFDLSSPEGISVNDRIPKEYDALVYEILNNVVRLIAQAGREVVMMK